MTTNTTNLNLQSSRGFSNSEVAKTRSSAFDLPVHFQVKYLQDQLTQVTANIGKVTKTLLRMEGELQSLDLGYLAKKDIITLVTNSKVILGKLEFLKSVFLQGSENLSHKEPDKHTNSPFDIFMDTPDQEIDQMIKRTVNELNEIDIAKDLQLDSELSAKVEAHKTNLEMLKPLLTPNIINSRGSAIAHIESILAIFHGMHDLRRQEEGLFEIASKKLEEVSATGFTNPERAAELNAMIEKANKVINELFKQRENFENALQNLKSLRAG